MNSPSSKIKTIIFSLGLFALIVISIEISSFFILSIMLGHPFSRVETLADMKATISSDASPRDARYFSPPSAKPQVTHPFIGFVRNGPTPEDEFGFRNANNPFQKKSAEKIILAITGGSFALELFTYSTPTLIEQLKLNPQFKDKEFISLNFAAGGLKQPQQLMALNYFLSLGAEFDILINIDGFNEVALPLAENIKQGIFPFFPRRWGSRIDLLSDPTLFLNVSYGVLCRNIQHKSSRLLTQSVVSRFTTAYLVWTILDNGLSGQIQKTEQNLPSKKSIALSYAARGPQVNYSSPDDLHQAIVSHWEKSTLLMNDIAHSQNIRYFHFLQPNQYLKDSKVLNLDEKEHAFSDTHPYKKPIESIYPLMRENIPSMQAKGLAIEDLTLIFKDTIARRYRDACCHLTKVGYHEVAEIIATSINRSISSETDLD